MLKIRNYDKIKKRELFSQSGLNWYVSEVYELWNRYDFILNSKDVSKTITITIGRDLRIGESSNPSYKLYKNGNGLDYYVTSDWISDMDNLIGVFSDLC